MGVLPDWMIENEVKIEPMSPMQKREGKISYGVTSYGYDARLGYRFKIPTPHKCSGGIIDPKVPDPSAYEELDLTPPVCHDWKDELGIQSSQQGPVVIDRKCRRCGVLESRRDEYADSFRLEQDEKCFARTKPNYIVIPPGSLVLGETVETFEIPRSVLCVVVGKSTYARCGIVVNVTPGEPEWKGKWTVEISNTSPMPVKVYCGEGIMQCIFFRSDSYNTENLRVTKELRTCKVSYLDKKGKYQDQTGLTLGKADGEVKGG